MWVPSPKPKTLNPPKLANKHAKTAYSSGRSNRTTLVSWKNNNITVSLMEFMRRPAQRREKNLQDPPITA